MMEKINVWAVYSGATEYYEGEPRWFFTDRSKAKITSYGRGYYHGDASIEEFTAFVDGDKIYVCTKVIPTKALDVSPNDIEEIRERALEKIASTLTVEERDALGL